MVKRQRPPHNYSEDTKEMCLHHVGVGEERKQKSKVSAYTFTADASGPDPSTIYRWKRQQQAPSRDPMTVVPRGRPPKLSSIEKNILGGWVLDRAENHERTSAHDIVAFVAENFQEQVSKQWVSNTMQGLQLTSHRATKRPQKYKKPNLVGKLHTFLCNLRNKIDGKLESSQVVAIDNVRFSHPQAILRSYSPKGG